nr:DHH family phosphoesterase [Planctomycetota bacterium]
MAIDWSPLIEIIRSNDRFVLSSHVRPDADALGSELGLAYALESLGKSVRIVNPSAASPNLGFLDPDGRAKKIGDSMTADEARDTDVHIVVDTSAWTQLQDVGEVIKTTAAQKVIIDHHVSSDDLGGLVIKDTSAAATGELIFELAQALEAEIREEAATALYCAIATDTGWFRFPSTTPRTMHIAGQLIDAGAKPHVLYSLLYAPHSTASMRPYGRVLRRLTFDCVVPRPCLTVSRADVYEPSAVPA